MLTRDKNLVVRCNVSAIILFCIAPLSASLEDSAVALHHASCITPRLSNGPSNTVRQLANCEIKQVKYKKISYFCFRFTNVHK